MELCPLLLLLLLAGPELSLPTLLGAWAQPLSSPPDSAVLLLPSDRTGASRQAMVSYVLTIEGRSFTIHLQQQVFLADDFRVYVPEQEQPLSSDSVQVKGDCHYRGHVEGFPSSAVTLSSCAGIRGLLQFENISYGIEPLGYSPGSKHFVYPVGDKDSAGPLLASSHPQGGVGRLEVQQGTLQAGGDKQLLPAAPQPPKVLRVSVVLDKALYTYMGENMNTAAQKIIQAFNFVNSMFHPLNLTILLSSLELWTRENQISTALEAHELQPHFVQWKQLHSTQPADDLALLLLYKTQAALMGATMQGTACQKDDAGVVAVYQRFMTLESFSVLLTQLLGHSLGMSYDDANHCQCHRHSCIMSHTALSTGGAKGFSNCSIEEFETFLKQKGSSSCLFSRGRWRRPSPRVVMCGNGVVEPGEQCDCGTGEACSKDKCCTKTCHFKPGVKCSSGVCCSDCQFKNQQSLCRLAADPECDLPEVCSGSSASCPPDRYVQDGHSCAGGTGYCYQGRCRSPELQCQMLYGRGSKNAPTVCYEELNSQKDRFGHCGFQPRAGYSSCAWRGLRCGKLICTYPSSTPFPSRAAAVVYARVRQHLCVSLDYLNTSARRDPLLVPPGTKCGSGKLCINNTCHPLSVLALECDSAGKCHGHGVCDNKGQCHCQPGWKPPDCSQEDSRLREGSGGEQAAGGGASLLHMLKDPRAILAVSGVCILLAGAVAFVVWRRCRQKPPSTEGSAAGKGTSGAGTEQEQEQEQKLEQEQEQEQKLYPELAPWHAC